MHPAHSRAFTIGTLQSVAPRRGLADWQVKRVTGYMREFIDRDIGLEEIARLVGLSQFHFCTAFRLAVGKSPHHYLTALRITRARELLAEQSLSIIQVALAVGYQTPPAFTASFRKATNLTPSASSSSLPRAPLANKSLIWFAAVSSLVHAGVMAQQSFGMTGGMNHMGHLIGDVSALFGVAVVLGGLLWSADKSAA